MLTSKLEAARQRIRDRWYPAFDWALNEVIPWAPLTVPLSQACLALVSTCGLYQMDSQAPFDAWNDLGDPSFRAIHIDTPPDRLRIAHTHYDNKYVSDDAGVAFPIAHMHTLVAEGTVGSLFPWMYSFMGYLPETKQLVRETAPQVARRLKGEGAQVALLTPC